MSLLHGECGILPATRAGDRRALGSIHLIAVLPQAPDESRKYLDDLGVAIEEVKQAELDSISVHCTPTPILVNHQGVVVTSWVGKLSADGEAEVLRRLHEKTLVSS